MQYAVIQPDGTRTSLIQMHSSGDGESIRLVLGEDLPIDSVHDAGLLSVEEIETSERFCGQLVQAGYDHGRLVLTCMALGRPVGEQPNEFDDDVLVLPCGEIIKIDQWTLAESSCQRGGHFRILCDTEPWEDLPYALAQGTGCEDKNCRQCGGQRTAYQFSLMRSYPGSIRDRAPRAEVVRLRSRERFVVDLECGSIMNDQLLILGHVPAQRPWNSD